MENKENNCTRTPHERKLAYRSLLDQMENIEESEELTLNNLTVVGEILSQATVLDSETDKEQIDQQEIVLDSKVLLPASTFVRKYIDAFNVSHQSYEPKEFAEKIKKYLQRNEDEEYQNNYILRLMEEAKKLIYEVPKYRSMYGSYDLHNLPEPKQKKQRVKIVKETLEKKQPEKLTQLEKEEDGIDEIVTALYNILLDASKRNGGQPINYYDYVIDGDSFSNTVENMFYVAFLIRDGKAEFSLGENGTPLIKPMSKNHLEAFKKAKEQHFQVITCVSQQRWLELQRVGLIQQKWKRIT